MCSLERSDRLHSCSTSPCYLPRFAWLSFAIAHVVEAVSAHVTSIVENRASDMFALARLRLASLAQCINLHSILVSPRSSANGFVVQPQAVFY